MENDLTYTKNGDHLIPNLSLSEQRSKPLGKYGWMRKAYLKEHRPGLYSRLLLSEKLYPHCLEIEETANRRLDEIRLTFNLFLSEAEQIHNMMKQRM